MTVIDENSNKGTSQEDANLIIKNDILSYFGNVVDSFIHEERIKDIILEDKNKSKIIMLNEFIVPIKSKDNIYSTSVKRFTKSFIDSIPIHNRNINRGIDLVLGSEYIKQYMNWNELIDHINTCINNQKIVLKDHKIVTEICLCSRYIIRIYLRKLKT